MSIEKDNVLILVKPIDFGSKTISELEFRDMQAQDMRSIRDGMTFGDLLDIGAKLSNQPKSLVNKLCPEDANRLVEYVGNALAGGV